MALVAGKLSPFGTPTLPVYPAYVGFTPADLGASLYDYWDAEQLSTITFGTGSAVATWTSIKNGYAANQSTAGARPVYSATGFNSRPGITFDGVDDALSTIQATVFPQGSTAVEMWIVVDNNAAISGSPLAYGTGTGAINSRRLNMNYVAAASRMQAIIGNNTTVLTAVSTNTIDAAGRHIVRAIVSPTQTSVTIDNVSGSATSVVPATSGNALSIGKASHFNGSYYGGVINFAAFTMPLTSDQALRFYNYLLARLI